MSDLLTTGGSGFAGAIIGAIGSFLGLKSKIDSQKERLDRLANGVMYSDTCDARHDGVVQRLDTQNDMLKEIRDILREK